MFEVTFEFLWFMIKIPFIALHEIIISLPSIIVDLPSMALPALQGILDSIMGLFTMLGAMLSDLWDWLLEDPRRLMTVIVLAIYAMYKCMYGTWCMRFYQKPGWGEPSTHTISPLRTAEEG